MASKKEVNKEIDDTKEVVEIPMLSMIQYVMNYGGKNAEVFKNASDEDIAMLCEEAPTVMVILDKDK